MSEKTANRYTELRLVFDSDTGYYGLMTDEGLFVAGITELVLNESVNSFPVVTVDLALTK